MVTADLHSQFATLSPLALDLALARVDLAAVHARRGERELDPEAREAANRLKNYFSRQLRRASSSTEISEKLVPDERFRLALKECFTSIIEAKPQLREGDTKLLNELIGALSPLVETGRCEREQAKQLHSVLRQWDVKCAAPSPRTDEIELWELQNAFS